MAGGHLLLVAYLLLTFWEHHPLFGVFVVVSVEGFGGPIAPGFVLPALKSPLDPPGFRWTLLPLAPSACPSQLWPKLPQAVPCCPYRGRILCLHPFRIPFAVSGSVLGIQESEVLSDPFLIGESLGSLSCRFLRYGRVSLWQQPVQETIRM